MSKIQLVTDKLIDHLVREIESADSIYILTSFVMKSGVELLYHHLELALARRKTVKLCAGDYLFVTQPVALQRLLELEGIELRLFQSNGRSFHPKAYLFGSESETGSFLVGSSNLSRSALTSGVEWNLFLPESSSPSTYQEAEDLFLHTFYHDNTIPLNEESIQLYKERYEHYHEKYPDLLQKWSKLEEVEMTVGTPDQTNTIHESRLPYGIESESVLEPRQAQLEALEALEATLEEGYTRAMVVLPTGIGKTYLAGFFARSFKRVLFVAHREEILYQAKNSFQHVLPDRSTGIYNGRVKDKADMLFASVFTIGQEKNLKQFSPDEFDLIVVDEFHHAAANSYQGIIDYFKPAFLLGITATPDRMDSKDVYGICGGNVAYQMHFIEAIQNDWLTPFRYFGVYDETDYSKVTWLGNKYDQEELLAAQLKDEVADKILRAWVEHKQSRSLGFCSSIVQANFLAEYFNDKGYKAISLNSKSRNYSRKDAIDALTNGDVAIIFTVDLFNEGVDIPPVDTLLFARPTESLTIFTQQVGRGLRLHNGKEYCNIIDLIGNYRNADIKLSLFDTSPEQSGKKKTVEPVVPANCELNLDLKVVDLLKELKKKRQPRKEKLFNGYQDLKLELGRRPSYLELHLYGRENSREYRQEFGSYPGFLQWAGELAPFEEKVYRDYESWVKEVERTGMAKSYKMIVLHYMLSRGMENWLASVTPKEVAPYFHQYLTEKEYRRKIDFSDKGSRAMWEYDESKVASLIARMPMTKWSGSSKGLVVFDDGTFSFDLELDNKEENELLYNWTKEICEYRLHEHFERKAR
ncbi:DEAD/DEAH box helicase family protein [Guptibacillus hwajinpoensis]|uniref:DEAD/DEAH box helicase family protein n=1 Tax=Guptibacillus hwajinpoensis TaxID=208199 RepID=UPI001CD6723E|nr:DEAD/DEAH box helicase family protein [Pseudalkalibacillus hwajinpoensis]MCA0993495.1 DEAD/DEAH box helicase family protein [Pseudalkalibacillus hwajinpoensis]